MKILVVNDSSEDANILRGFLDLHGHSAIIAIGAKDAVSKFIFHQSSGFDLVISKLAMKPLNGFWLARELEYKNTFSKTIILQTDIELGYLIKPPEVTVILKTEDTRGILQYLESPWPIDRFCDDYD